MLDSRKPSNFYATTTSNVKNNIIPTISMDCRDCASVLGMRENGVPLKLLQFANGIDH